MFFVVFGLAAAAATKENRTTRAYNKITLPGQSRTVCNGFSGYNCQSHTGNIPDSQPVNNGLTTTMAYER